MNVVLTVAVVALASAAMTGSYLLSRKVLTEFREAETAHRLERAAIMRAVVARTGAELAMLDKHAGIADARRAGSNDDPRRQVSREEWDAMIRADMERGLGGEPQPILEGM